MYLCYFVLLVEGLSHQMEECNKNGRWSRVAQSHPELLSFKSLLLYVYLFNYSCIITVSMYILRKNDNKLRTVMF